MVIKTGYINSKHPNTRLFKATANHYIPDSSRRSEFSKESDPPDEASDEYANCGALSSAITGMCMKGVGVSMDSESPGLQSSKMSDDKPQWTKPRGR